MYTLYYTQEAKKDFKKITQSNLKHSCLRLLALIKQDPLNHLRHTKKEPMLACIHVGLTFNIVFFMRLMNKIKE